MSRECPACGAETCYPVERCWRCSGHMVKVETTDDTTEVEVTLDETKEERENRVTREQNIRWMTEELGFTSYAAELLFDRGVRYHEARHLVRDLECPVEQALEILV